MVLPAWVLVIATTGRAVGHSSVDLVWATWRYYAAGHGPFPVSTLVGYPEGLDIATMIPGWLDIGVGALLGRFVGTLVAYDLVVALWVALAGLGGLRLARALGVSPGGAVIAGLVLQLDPHLWFHVEGGRIEHGPQGLVALAVAGAITLWRAGRARDVVAVGVLGGLVVASSWELGLVCAIVTVLLGLVSVPGPRPPGAVARWVGAGVITALIAAPLVARLVLSQRGLPHADGFGRWIAAHHAVGVLGFAAPGVVRPPYATWPAVLALAWTARGPRRPWVGLGLAALALAAAATGPNPAWFAATPPRLPADTDPSALDAAAGALWAPWTWLQGLPGLDRYHWPERLLAAASLIVAPACGAAWDAAAPARRRFVGPGLIAGIALELVVNGWAPAPRFRLEAPPELVAFAEAPPGALVNLPPQPNPSRHSDDHLQQMVHGHPMLFSMQLRHLRGPGLDLRVEGDPVLRWFAALARGDRVRPTRFAPQDFAELRASGFRYVSLHRADLDAGRWSLATAALAALGDPAYASPPGRDGARWQVWDLDAPR